MTRLREDEHSDAPDPIPPPDTDAEKKAEARPPTRGRTLRQRSSYAWA